MSRELVLFALFLVLGSSGVTLWLWAKSNDIAQIREHREKRKIEIHEDMRRRYIGTIIDETLESRCGKAVYTLAIWQDDGRQRLLHYDIDTGRAVSDSWMNACLRSPSVR